MDAKEIETLAASVKSSTAAGPSGIDGNYIHHLTQCKTDFTFRKILLHAFNDILQFPNRMSEIPELY